MEAQLGQLGWTRETHASCSAQAPATSQSRHDPSACGGARLRVQVVHVRRQVQVQAQQRQQALQARQAGRIAAAVELVHHLAHLPAGAAASSQPGRERQRALFKC